MNYKLRLLWPIIVAVTLTALWVNHSRADAPTDQYYLLNGTAYDTKTQLTWQQMTTFDTYSWDEAQLYCQNLMLNGSGWRVPSVKELQSLVDETRANPSVDVTAFPGTAPTRYWTSTRRASNLAQAWLVGFDFGATGAEDAKNPHPVRCVR